MDMTGKNKIKMVSLDAVIIKADGTRIDLGTVSYYHRNPLKRWAWHITHFIKGVKRDLRKLANRNEVTP